MFNRYYFMKTTTELTSGERKYNDVIRTHRSLFREDHDAYLEMVKGVADMWKGSVDTLHVTDFKKL
jgi:hypothetical protein